jgi:PAS domain S-box-containing protein
MDSDISAPNRGGAGESTVSEANVVRTPASNAGLLDRVFHGSLVGMVVARFDDGVVLEANDTFCSLVGRNLGEVLGANVDDLGLWGDLGPDRARERLRQTGLIDGYDTSVISSEGETRIVRVWAELLDGIDRLVIVRASDVDGRASAKARYLELREAEVRYRAMVEQIPAITYTLVPDAGPSGYRGVYVSPQVTTLLGYGADEWMSDPSLWVTAIHPDDRERVIRGSGSAAERKRFECEYRMVARDGTIRWFRDQAVFVEEPTTGARFWQGVMMDITEARLAAEHHAATDAKYRSLVEQIPAVVYLAEYGEDGDWVYISPQIDRVMGYTPEEWLAHPAPQGTFTHPDDLPGVREEEERSRETGTPFRYEYRMRRRDGKWLWILDEASVVRDEDGNPLFLQGVMYDITQRRQTEERLFALNRLNNTLLHTLSHDLKEPLTAILGAASTLDRLDRDLDPAERSHLLKTMVERTKAMNALLSDLLDLDRLDRGIVEPRRFPCDLGDLVHRLADRVELLHHRKVEFDDVHITANVDEPKVERIIDNLLLNAVRYTPARAHIWVRMTRGGEGGTTIVVEDDGPGVPDEHKLSIFEAFRRGPRSKAKPGSGIGLSLVARFAELHGGRAWVEDREGGGASFHVYLPDTSDESDDVAR